MKCKKIFCKAIGTQHQGINEHIPKKSIVKQVRIGAIIAIISIATVVNLCGCSDIPTNISGNNNDNKNTATAALQEEKFSLNDTAEFKDLKFTANELKESTGNDMFKPAEGKVFVGIHFVIENTSDKDQIISSLALFDAYADNVKCDYSFSAAVLFGESIDNTLTSGQKLEGYYCLEVPENWTEIELSVKSDLISSEKASFIFNK